MSRTKQYQVNLSEQERKELENFVACGKKNARAINRARILLLASEGKKDRDIVEVLGISRQTVHCLRKQFVESKDEHILEFLKDAPRSGRPIKIDSSVEAHVTMIACSEPPEGCAKWTLRMIADRLVKLEVIEAISHESVRTTLKKTS